MRVMVRASVAVLATLIGLSTTGTVQGSDVVVGHTGTGGVAMLAGIRGLVGDAVALRLQDDR